MKYNIIINQIGIVENGLLKKTDIIDWCIIDYLKDWYFAETKKTIFVQDDGCNYVWVNYNHLIQEMPIIGIKEKIALMKRFKKLKKLGLIKTFQDKKNNLYFILTPKCIEIIGFKPTPKQEGLYNDGYTGLYNDGYTGLYNDGYTAQIYNQANNIPRNNNIYNNLQHSANAEVGESISNSSISISKNKKKNNKDETEKEINQAIRELLKYFDEWFKYLFKIGYTCEFKVEFELLKRDFKRYLKEKGTIEKTKNFFLDLIDIYFNEIRERINKGFLPNPNIKKFHNELARMIVLYADKNYKFYRLEVLKK
jgi:hypothetical protein